MPPCQPCRACPCHGPSLRPTTRHMGHRAVLTAWRAAGSTGARGASGGARGSLADPTVGLRGGAKGGARAAAPASSISGRQRCRCVCSALVGSPGWRARRLGVELSRASAAGWSSTTCPQGGGASASWAPGARTGRGGGGTAARMAARRCNCHGDRQRSGVREPCRPPCLAPGRAVPVLCHGPGRRPMTRTGLRAVPTRAR
jgi:hypothetical protein